MEDDILKAQHPLYEEWEAEPQDENDGYLADFEHDLREGR